MRFSTALIETPLSTLSPGSIFNYRGNTYRYEKKEKTFARCRSVGQKVIPKTISLTQRIHAVNIQ